MESNLNINVNGLHISYCDEGSGDVPVIFIHGFPFNKECWEPQINFLKQTHRVIAYDIRGFGHSDTNHEKASMALFANDLIAFMDALKIKKAIVCGFSMGGYVLLNAIDRYPERFTAIILSDTQCGADNVEAKEKRYKTAGQIEEGKLNDFAKDFIKKAFCENSLNNKKQLVEKVHSVILSTSPKTIVNALAAIAQREDKCNSLNKISIPVLIICGKEDALTPIAKSEGLFKAINNSSLKIISDAGHLSNLEQADEFNKCVFNFINTLLKEK